MSIKELQLPACCDDNIKKQMQFCAMLQYFWNLASISEDFFTTYTFHTLSSCSICYMVLNVKLLHNVLKKSVSSDEKT